MNERATTSGEKTSRKYHKNKQADIVLNRKVCVFLGQCHASQCGLCGRRGRLMAVQRYFPSNVTHYFHIQRECSCSRLVYEMHFFLISLGFFSPCSDSAIIYGTTSEKLNRVVWSLTPHQSNTPKKKSDCLPGRLAGCDIDNGQRGPNNPLTVTSLHIPPSQNHLRAQH